MTNVAEKRISIAACAARIGVNRSTLLRQIKKGQVRQDADGVRLSDVLADRLKNVDLHRSRRWRGEIDNPIAPSATVHKMARGASKLAAAVALMPDATADATRHATSDATGDPHREPDRLTTVGRAAKALGLDRRAIFDMVHAGTLRVDAGKVRLSEVEAALNARYGDDVKN